MAKAASLSVDFSANLAQLQTDFTKVETQTRALGQSMERSFSTLGGSFERLSGVVAGLGGALERIGLAQAGQAAETTASAIGGLATAIGGGPVGLIARIVALSGTVTAGIAAWRNWDTVINTVTQSLSRNARARVGGQVTAQGTTDFEEYIAGITGEGGLPQTPPDATEVTRRFAQEQERLRQQLQADRSTLEGLRSTWEQVQTARAGDPNSRFSEAVLRRVQDYEAALARITQNEARLGSAETLRDRALNTILGRGYPTPPIPPEGGEDTGGGGGGGRRTDQALQDLERRRQAVQRLAEPWAQIEEQVRLASEMWERGQAGMTDNILTSEQYTRVLSTLGEQMGRLGQQTRQMQQPLTEMQAMVLGFSDDFAKLFVGAFFQADQDLGKALTSMLRRLLEFLTQLLIFKPLFKEAVNFLPSWLGGTPATTGTSTGGGIGSIPNSVPSAPSGGQRAAGGRVAAGVGYTVGEFGPERFIPSVPGSIGRGGGDMTVIVNAPPGTQVARREERQNPFGGRELEVWLEGAVNRGITTGRFDAAMGATYGASRIGRV